MRTAQILLAALLALPIAAQTTLIEEGRTALLRDDRETAATLFRKAVEAAPESADAHYWLGTAYGRIAQTANVFRQLRLAMRARDEFERAIALNPGHLDAHFALVEYYLLAPAFLGGSERKALQQASEIKKLDGPAGYRALAFIYSHQKKRDLARREYLQAVAEHPDSAQAHYALATFYITTDKNYHAAAAELETTVRLDPGTMPAWFEIGHVAALTGTNLTRGEEALRTYLTYTPAEIDDPPLARALYWLGAIYERRGHKGDARESYAASLRLDATQKDVTEAMQRLR